MNNKIKQGLVGGIAATVVMTAFMMIAPVMGIPEMSPPGVLATMMGLPILLGWIMHFIIGVIFALAYAFFFLNWVNRIKSNLLKGVIFGFVAFIYGQIGMGILGTMMGGMPASSDSMMSIMIGSIFGHIVFGIVVAQLVKLEDVTVTNM